MRGSAVAKIVATVSTTCISCNPFLLPSGLRAYHINVCVVPVTTLALHIQSVFRIIPRAYALPLKCVLCKCISAIAYGPVVVVDVDDVLVVEVLVVLVELVLVVLVEVVVLEVLPVTLI